MKFEMDVPNSPYGLCGRKATLKHPRSCVKVEVAVLGSPSLIVRTVSADVRPDITVMVDWA